MGRPMRSESVVDHVGGSGLDRMGVRVRASNVARGRVRASGGLLDSRRCEGVLAQGGMHVCGTILDPSERRVLAGRRVHVGGSVLDSESVLARMGVRVLASSAGRERVSGGRVDLRMCGSVQRGMNVRETIPGSSAPARMELHMCGRVLDSGRVVAQR